jgi:Uma2 family endonuclease
MATVLATGYRLRPDMAGMRLTPEEFDASSGTRGHRYELISGVLVVTPMPGMRELDPNDQLGFLLRLYRETNPQGHRLDLTVPEFTIQLGDNRRRPDRALWIGLGRMPHEDEMPSILVEFVSKGRQAAHRDYDEKREEYAVSGASEYWIFDSFRSRLTVWQFEGETRRSTVFGPDGVYESPLLPGFKLPVGDLLALAQRWAPVDDDE